MKTTYKGPIFEEHESGKRPMIVVVSRSTLIAAIRDAGIKVPVDADVTFRVPSGGDYSGVDVELDDKEQVISVRYEV